MQLQVTPGIHRPYDYFMGNLPMPTDACWMPRTNWPVKDASVASPHGLVLDPCLSSQANPLELSFPKRHGQVNNSVSFLHLICLWVTTAKVKWDGLHVCQTWGSRFSLCSELSSCWGLGSSLILLYWRTWVGIETSHSAQSLSPAIVWEN